MDFIKKLIAGILGFLTGLLPGNKKSNGFYLELDEAATGATPTVTAKPAAVSNGKKTLQAVVPEAPATPAPKPVKVEASQNGNGKVPKAEPAKEPIPTTFAPQYVAATVPSSNSRRRPGANMSVYLDLASQIKTPG
ncbi:MAG: hypothetical protein ACFKPT_24815 [Gloeotrichia echinulata GP01]